MAISVSPVTAAQGVNEAIEETGAIFTYILDTNASAENALSSEELVSKDSWSIVEADVTDHEFSGDTVLLNDAIALVLRKHGSGAELYARGPAGYALRAALIPVGIGGEFPTELQTVVIRENTPGAVAIDAMYRTDPSDPVAVQFRLVTGQIYVETQRVENAESLAVRLNSEYLIVPDFFADDLVYQAKDLVGARAGLPAENFLLHLIAGGDALVTCVWKEREQSATAVSVRNEGTLRIEGTDIAYAPDAPVWVAVLERPDVWHAQSVVSGADLKLEWTPPFPARWRADFLGGSEAAESWNFEEDRLAEYTSPFHGAMVYPCWLRNEDAYVRTPPTMQPEPSKAVVYPIDRTRGTPLDVFCLVDIMRGTLGFGACQYVLDLEGLDAQSSPTPALVMEWVERQFKAGRDERSRALIEERLEAMVDHVTHSDQRIKAYGAFARELIASFEDNTRLGEGIGESETVRKMTAIAVELIRANEVYETLGVPMALAREEAARVVAAIGQPNGEDMRVEVAERLDSLGATQDRVLSKGRMAVRRVAQLAQDSLKREPDWEAGATIFQRANDVLSKTH